ncbi:conserved hypothetical protein [Methanohalobium evestigatum Z-7303]|uniref:Uncharacterized protein n=1 Tax=Methanohalobium evestigatum (strain ATCC BAA-1072 / DSM 3721 / NBRC 107634 / OCM 161 / Z-7303) TaxID=644295 RepID=D7E6Q4_METEZ|nr:hypothetical protein [Methanohalobium evestigatum]ADI73276.1 conserved hypothetical protein [Methanohalobium evestigatum Z-7303]
MTFSEINEKPTYMHSEDLLTSDVFGCCSFLEYRDLLDYLLKMSTHFASGNGFTQSREVISDNYFFWPRFKTDLSFIEPDVLIILWHSNNSCSLVIVESKYLSGKSSEADYDIDNITDQLAKELMILETKSFYSQLSSLKRVHVLSEMLLYVSADNEFPEKSFIKSANEYLTKTNTKANRETSSLPLYWLPWWRIENFIYSYLDEKSDDINLRKYRVLKHIRDVLAHKNLSRFVGFRDLFLGSIQLPYSSASKIIEVGKGQSNFYNLSISLDFPVFYGKEEKNNQYDFFVDNLIIDYQYNSEV